MEPYRIRFHVSAPFEMERDGDAYVSSCSSFDVFSQGETEKKALENLAEAVQLFLESCLMRHTLEKVLSDRGFELDKGSDYTEGRHLDDKQMVDIQISLVARAQTHAARLAHSCTHFQS